MNKKILLPLLAIALLIAFVVIGILQYRSQRLTLPQTVPLVPAPTITRVVRPVAEITRAPSVPKETDIAAVTITIADKVSQAEKDKIDDLFPIRKEDFPTSVKIKTTINIYSLDFDPVSSVRLEIYGINYNEPDLKGPNAIAFKESFLEAKNMLAPRGVILKNLQIIFGNRQYIQDTATYWVKAFKLLD